MRLSLSIVIASLLIVVGCKNKPIKHEEITDTAASTETNTNENIEDEKEPDSSTEASTEGDLNQKVKISTQYGDMIVKLYDETPKHRDNFIKLVKKGFYNDLLFHRVMQGFMIQGGDPASKGAATTTMLGQGGPGYTIPAKILPELIHKKGALAAARQPDNVNPNKESSGSQFYLVQGNVYTPENLRQLSQQMKVDYTPEQVKTYTTIGGTPFLDSQYTVFGEVVEGIDVIDKIAAQPVNQQFGNRPYKDISFKISLIEE